MIDLRTGDVTQLPSSIATSGTYFAVSPDHTAVAYSTCCNPAGAPLHGERRRDADTPDLRDRTRRLRRTVVSGRLDARVSATERLDPASREPVRPGRRDGTTYATHELRSDAAVGLVVHVPELRAGRSVDPVPAAERRPGNNKPGTSWSVPVAGGQQTLVRRNAAWGGYSPDGTRLRVSLTDGPQDMSGGGLWIEQRRRGNARSPGRRRTTHVAEVVPGWDADLVRGRRIDLCAGVATGSATRIADGGTAEWFDDHTLIVGTGG